MLAYFFCRPGRAGVEDDAVKNQPPDGLGNFDHARIGKEFLEKAPHRTACRFIGRAEVDQQDAGLKLRAVLEWRFGEEGHFLVIGH